MTKGGGKACRVAHNDSENLETQSTWPLWECLPYSLHCPLASGPAELQLQDFLLKHWLLSIRELVASARVALEDVAAVETASESRSQAASSPQGCESREIWQWEKRHETRALAAIEVIA
jgi:hypothetical protein